MIHMLRIFDKNNFYSTKGLKIVTCQPADLKSNHFVSMQVTSTTNLC